MSSHLIRSDLIPILGGYVILMVVIAVGLWAQRRRAAAGLPGTRLTGRRDHGWRALILHVLTDAVSGYLVLMAIVVLLLRRGQGRQQLSGQRIHRQRAAAGDCPAAIPCGFVADATHFPAAGSAA
jgi:hypothetical protein